MALRLTSERMAAFSDGVIAVIITIMVLELKAPEHGISDWEGLRKVLPRIGIYALSFVEVGIYWVNHHYLVDDVKQVSHGLLWSNLWFLFTLSLIPFGTAWLGERGLTPFSVALYAVCCALPAFSWFVLSGVICRRTRQPLAGSPAKQGVSCALYLGAIPISYYSIALAIAMLAAVSVLWLIPPRQVVEATRKRQD